MREGERACRPFSKSFFFFSPSCLNVYIVEKKKSFSREHKKATDALDNLLHFSPSPSAKKDAFRQTFHDPKRNFSGESGSTNVPEWPFENDSASCQGWVFCGMMRYRKTILAPVLILGYRTDTKRAVKLSKRGTHEIPWAVRFFDSVIQVIQISFTHSCACDEDSIRKTLMHQSVWRVSFNEDKEF